ncbi:aminopeptidase P family protein [Ornithinibacillus gellani]|uniref:M24 family metallopeptidase n=1 Tax=Ornithinibacillus gellani TaxID=2293253 RepID=UPI000F4AB6F5|nr:Xaa-Pro peptidase family protein [Ornithinibacillus gellani]TQS74160.1 aminopeptidase P family protein [Ornithinibacillus gellani]
MTIDYQNRLDSLRTYAKENNMDIAMVTTPANVFYFTGFLSDPHERFMALVLDNRSDEYMLFVPALDKDLAAEASIVEKIIPISDEQNPYEIVQQHLGEDVEAFGLEMKTVTMFQHQQLEAAFPKAAYGDIQPFINTLRLRKSRGEIEHMQKAVDIIEKVLEEGLKKVRIGMTEAELAGELEFLMKKFGAEGPSFSTIVLAGEKSALPHGSPGDRQLQHGDFLLIDMGVKIKEGYCSDTTRTFVIGEASEKQKEIYQLVKESNQAGIDAVKAGVPLKEFDIAARRVIHDKGYGDYFNNRVGHGLGIELHEEPSVHENNENLAEKGLVFTIEPGIYLPGFGGVRIEDTVYINEAGEAEVLTVFPRELQII